LLPGYQIEAVTSEIETYIQSALLDGACIDNDGNGAYAISKEPVDVPGSQCEQSDDGAEDGLLSTLLDLVTPDTTCYTVAGRATVIISTESILNTANIYCTALETIRSYISSGTISDLVPGVYSIGSPLLSRIIPALCNAIPDYDNRKLSSNERRVADIQTAVDQSIVVNALQVSDNGSLYGLGFFGFLVIAGAIMAIVYPRNQRY
jgi:hypothetical protein